VRFSHKAAQNVDAQRHYFGFVEELITKEGTEMRFLVPHLKYFAGWLLQYNDEVELIAGGVLRPVIHSLLGELSHHWQDE